MRHKEQGTEMTADKEFLETVLEGFTKEELEIYSSFFQRLFKNTKNAMEGRNQS